MEFCLCNNENCYKCNGTGIISQDNSSKIENSFNICTEKYNQKKKIEKNSLGNSYQLIRNENGKLEKKPINWKEKYKRCFLCGKNIKAKKIHEHMLYEHKEFRSYASFIRRIGKSTLVIHRSSLNSRKINFNFEGVFFIIYYSDQINRDFAICPVCDKFFFEFKILEHIEYFHENRKNIIIKEFKCSHCGILLTKEDTLKHKKLAHPNMRDSRFRVIKMNNSQNIGELINYDYITSNSKLFVDSGRDLFDATRTYAHNFRENGKYGSHPIHDDHNETDNE